MAESIPDSTIEGQGRAIVVQLARAVRARRLAAGSEARDRAVDVPEALLRSFVRRHGAFELRTTPDALACHGELIPAAAVEDLALPLIRQGLVSLALDGSFTRETLGGLLDILGAGPGSAAAPAEDVVIRLWRADLPGLSHTSELAGLLTASADGPALERRTAEVLETLSDAPPAQDTVPTPPAPPPALAALVREAAREDRAAIVRRASRVVERLVAGGTAPDGVDADGVRRALDSVIGALVDTGDEDALRRLIKAIAARRGGAVADAAKGLLIRWVESDRRLGDDGASAARVVAEALGDDAVRVLEHRARGQRGPAAGRALAALARVAPDAARALLAEQLEGAAAPTAAALALAVSGDPELFDDAIGHALVGAGTRHPAIRAAVARALDARGGTGAGAALLAWSDPERLLGAAPTDQASLLEALVAVGPPAEGLARIEAILKTRALLSRKAWLGLQVAAARALHRTDRPEALALLDRFRRSRSDELREACEQSMRSIAARGSSGGLP